MSCKNDNTELYEIGKGDGGSGEVNYRLRLDYTGPVKVELTGR